MTVELEEIAGKLKSILTSESNLLRIRKDSDAAFEVCGTIPAMQGKQKVDGYYFASVVPKPKDIRLYFFPIYTHVNEFNPSDEMKKCLKGKSCFHIKKLSNDLESEFKLMIKKGVELYSADGLI